MKVKVKLQEILEALEFQSEMAEAYLDLQTGRVLWVFDEFSDFDDTELLESTPKINRDLFETAREVLSDEGGRYIALPSKYDFNEWDLMRRFALYEVDPKVTDELLDAIHGRGAFRRFKEAIHRLGVAEQWYDYRETELRQIAIDWCESHGLEYEE